MAYDFPSSPSNGQLYPAVVAPGEAQWQWSTADGKWIVVSTGVTGAIGMDDLTDADTSTVPPTIGQALVWDGVNWVPDTVAGGSGENVPLKGLTFAPVDPLGVDYTSLASGAGGATTGLTILFDDASVDVTDGGSITPPEGAKYVLISAQMTHVPAPSPGDISLRLYAEVDAAAMAANPPYTFGQLAGARMGMDVVNTDQDALQQQFIAPFDTVNNTIALRVLTNDDASNTTWGINLVGFFCEEAPSGAPLEGLTFVPIAHNNTGNVFARSLVAGDYDTNFTVDLTNGGALTVPDNATHVWVRGRVNGNFDANYGTLLYVEGSAPLLTATGRQSRLNVDPILADLGPSTWEGQEIVSFPVEIGSNNEIFVRLEQNSPGSPTNGSYGVNVLGWFIQEAAGTAAGSLPLKGLTLRPTQNEDKEIAAITYPIGPVAAGPTPYLTGSLNLATVEGVPVEATHAVIRIEHVQTTNVEMGINIFVEKDDTTRDLATTTRRLTSTSVPNDNVVNVYESSELVTTVVELPSQGVGTLSYKAQPLDTQSGSITGGTLRFYLEGYYIEEANGGIQQQLEGYTFFPADDPNASFYNETFTGTGGTGTGTTDRTLDLTLASTPIPAGASHVRIRVDANATNDEHGDRWVLLFEKDATTIGLIDDTSVGTARPFCKVEIDPADNKSGDGNEGQSFSTFTIPFDTLSNTIRMKLVFERTAAADRQLIVRTWVEGYYVQETLDLPEPLTITDGTTTVTKTQEIIFNQATVTGLGNGVAEVDLLGQPLEGLTFIPTYEVNSDVTNPLVQTNLFDFGANTATINETVGPFSVDVTGGGTITVPDGAAYVKVRATIRAQAELDNNNQMYFAEADVATLGTIAQIDGTKAKAIIDLSPRTAAPTFEPEMDVNTTFTIPFDTLTNTFQHRMDLASAVSSASNSSTVNIFIEGFYVQETGNIIERRILNPPLEGLTFEPVNWDTNSTIETYTTVTPSFPVLNTPVAVDITNGGLKPKPDNALYAAVEVVLNFNMQNNASASVSVEESSAALAGSLPRLTVDGVTSGATSGEGGGQITSPVLIGAGDQIWYRINSTSPNTDFTNMNVLLRLVGWYIQETPPTIIGGNPLQGLTFVPNNDSVFVQTSSFSGNATATGTLIPDSAIDLTNGGAITIPENATHVLLRSSTNLNPFDNYLYKLYVEETSVELATIPVNDPTRFRASLDPTQQPIASYEQDLSSTFVVPIDIANEAVRYRWDLEIPVGASPGSAATFAWSFWIEGFYTSEEAILLDAPPLQGLTYVPTPGNADERVVWNRVESPPPPVGTPGVWQTISSGTVALDGSDPTYGFGTPTIDIPDNAVRVKLHYYFDMNVDANQPDGLNVLLQAEKDAATLATVGFTSTGGSWTRLDNLPELSGGILQAGEAFEANTFDIEFDPVTKTFDYRVNSNFSVTGNLWVLFKVLGFYVQESAKVEPVQPLEGLTFVSVDGIRQSPSNGVDTGRTLLAAYDNPLVSVSTSFSTASLPVPQGVIDLTQAVDGANITVPSNARYAVLDLHAKTAATGSTNAYAYVGKNPLAISATNIPLANENYTALQVSGSVDDSGSGTYRGAGESVVFAPIDEILNTVNYRFDINAAAGVSLMELNYEWYLQGFMVQESAAIARTPVSIQRWTALQIANLANNINLDPATSPEYHSLSPSPGETVEFALPAVGVSTAGDRFVVRLLASAGSIVNVRAGVAGPIIKTLESLSTRTKGAEFVFDGTEWAVFTAFDSET